MTAIDSSSSEPSTAKKVKKIFWLIYLIGFGVILPVITLIVELSWAWCAEAFFDPIPSLMHGFLVALVPMANLLALLSIYTKFRIGTAKLLFLNGLAIGISAFYTVLFIPLMPLAGLALIFLIGLLPLAPVLSLVATIMCRRALPRPSITDPIAAVSISNVLARLNMANWGIAVAIVMIVAIELPFTITEIGLRQASSTESAEQLRGLRLLRRFGDEDRLLSYGYQRRGETRDMISFFLNWNEKPVSVEQARQVYYRVTGRAFNDQSPLSAQRQGIWQNDLINFDGDQGGSRVGQRLEDVHLLNSQIDGSIDADAAIAYLQWTFEFSNQSTRLAEARAQISLPPGAVVSRVTLWINGEEREAAFAGRGQARQAYQSVVQRQRDPILVTTAGVDTVLVQLYPIASGGKMKARIGITVPLLLREENQAILQLPIFKQRNFNIAQDFKHSLWLEAEALMHGLPGHLIFESANAGASTLRGKLDDAELNNAGSNVLVSRDSRMVQSFAIDNRQKAKPLISQRISQQAATLENLVMVIDGSYSMRAVVEPLAEVIANLPGNLPVSIIVASDEPVELTRDLDMSDTASLTQLAHLLRRFEFVGGVDNTEALEKAWSLAASKKNSAVLWLHGAQPVLLNSVDNLRQNWRRRPQGPDLLDFPVSRQVNQISEALDGVEQFKSIERVASFKEDLQYQFSLWRGERLHRLATREAVAAPNTKPSPNLHTSDHLVRLWANDRIYKLMASGNKDGIKTATEIAVRYQLVTPVSGAVVLETQQQYADNDLQPVAEGTVPTIPEPETWLLIISTLSILSWLLYRRQQGQLAGRLVA